MIGCNIWLSTCGFPEQTKTKGHGSDKSGGSKGLRMLKKLSTIMLKLAMGWIGDEICEASVKFFKVEK